MLVGVPLLEIVVILQVAGTLGGWWTVALMVATSLVGAWLLRVEGRRAWSQFRAALADGGWPGDEVAQGTLVLLGGALLFLPGFVTDAVGFALLFTPTRRVLARFLRTRTRSDGGRSARGDAARPALDVEVVEIRREPLPPEGSPTDGRNLP